MKTVDSTPDPEQNASHSEFSDLLRAAVLGLPEPYRAVVMMRDIEEMSTKEAGEVLELSEENVKATGEESPELSSRSYKIVCGPDRS